MFHKIEPFAECFEQLTECFMAVKSESWTRFLSLPWNHFTQRACMAKWQGNRFVSGRSRVRSPLQAFFFEQPKARLLSIVSKRSKRKMRNSVSYSIEPPFSPLLAPLQVHMGCVSATEEMGGCAITLAWFVAWEGWEEGPFLPYYAGDKGEEASLYLLWPGVS